MSVNDGPKILRMAALVGSGPSLSRCRVLSSTYPLIHLSTLALICHLPATPFPLLPSLQAAQASSQPERLASRHASCLLLHHRARSLFVISCPSCPSMPVVAPYSTEATIRLKLLGLAAPDSTTSPRHSRLPNGRREEIAWRADVSIVTSVVKKPAW